MPLSLPSSQQKRREFWRQNGCSRAKRSCISTAIQSQGIIIQRAIHFHCEGTLGVQTSFFLPIFSCFLLSSHFSFLPIICSFFLLSYLFIYVSIYLLHYMSLFSVLFLVYIISFICLFKIKVPFPFLSHIFSLWIKMFECISSLLFYPFHIINVLSWIVIYFFLYSLSVFGFNTFRVTHYNFPTRF